MRRGVETVVDTEKSREKRDSRGVEDSHEQVREVGKRMGRE